MSTFPGVNFIDAEIEMIMLLFFLDIIHTLTNIINSKVNNYINIK
jgi:hypothetical protein